MLHERKWAYSFDHRKKESHCMTYHVLSGVFGIIRNIASKIALVKRYFRLGLALY